jgi:hypothetical protein
MKPVHPVEQLPLDRATQPVFARINQALTSLRSAISKEQRSGGMLAELFNTFFESLPELKITAYCAAREQLGAVGRLLASAESAPLSEATRKLAAQLVGNDLPRLAAIATKFNEEDSPKFFAAIRSDETTWTESKVLAKRKTTIRRADFDAAIDRILSKRLADMARLVKEDTARWLETQGVGGDTFDADGYDGPRFLLRKGRASWKLVFDGIHGELKEEKGMDYIAYLLIKTPGEAIHGSKLAARVFGYAEIAEESLGIDDAVTQRAIEKEATRLAAIMRNPTATESQKEKARQELEEMADARDVVTKRPETNAEKTVRAVRKSFQRAHANLVAQGKTDPAAKLFAEHIEKQLLVPSARFTRRRGSRTKAGVAGAFVYEPPDGVVWAG